MTKKKESYASWNTLLFSLANNGDSELQITLASKLLATSSDKQRVVEAYKWLFISLFLNNENAQKIIEFVRRGMSEEQVLEADGLVEKWIEEKNQELMESRNKEWSKEMLETFKNVKKGLLN
jgi:hypothetical protein